MHRPVRPVVHFLWPGGGGQTVDGQQRLDSRRQRTKEDETDSNGRAVTGGQVDDKLTTG